MATKKAAAKKAVSLDTPPKARKPKEVIPSTVDTPVAPTRPVGQPIRDGGWEAAPPADPVETDAARVDAPAKDPDELALHDTLQQVGTAKHTTQKEALRESVDVLTGKKELEPETQPAEVTATQGQPVIEIKPEYRTASENPKLERAQRLGAAASADGHLSATGPSDPVGSFEKPEGVVNNLLPDEDRRDNPAAGPVAVVPTLPATDGGIVHYPATLLDVTNQAPDGGLTRTNKDGTFQVSKQMTGKVDGKGQQVFVNSNDRAQLHEISENETGIIAERARLNK